MRLAPMLVTMLAKHGFDAVLERRSEAAASEFEVVAPVWSILATVKAVWDNPRRLVKGLNDEAPAAMGQRYMTIAYRDDLKDNGAAVGLRVVVNGVPTNVLSIGEIGEKVGLRLMLDTGTEA